MMKKKSSENNTAGSIQLHRVTDDSVAGFKTERKSREKVSKGSMPIVILAVVLVLTFLFSCSIFVSVSSFSSMTITRYMELSREKFHNFFMFVTGQGAKNGIQFVFYRYVIACLCGACLAAGGAVYQGTFRNILVSPSTLGVMSGGSLGNVVYVLLFVSGETVVVRYSDVADILNNATLFERNLQQLLVLVGCFGAVAIVAGITLALGKGRIVSSHLIITGMLFSSVVSSFTMLIQYYLTVNDGDTMRADVIRSLSMGSFSRSFTLEHLSLMALFLLPCMIILLVISGRLDLMMLGDDQARSMGMNVGAYKAVIISVNTIMTAVIIAFCGQIGFVGFIVPQAARRIAGPKFSHLLPACMLLGGILLILVYDIALLINMTEYINLLTSLLGSIVMIAAFISGKGGVGNA